MGDQIFTIRHTETNISFFSARIWKRQRRDYILFGSCFFLIIIPFRSWITVLVLTSLFLFTQQTMPNATTHPFQDFYESQSEDRYVLLCCHGSAALTRMYENDKPYLIKDHCIFICKKVTFNNFSWFQKTKFLVHSIYGIYWKEKSQ